MINTLNGVKFTTNYQENHTEVLRKCRYYNRGYFKFKENCNFFHSTSVCDTFLRDGICQEEGCRQRHPKDCRYWTRNTDGCSRKEKCDYLHNNLKKFSDAPANEPENIIENNDDSTYQCNKCDFKTTDRDAFNCQIVSCIYTKLSNSYQNEDILEIVNESCEQIKCDV